MPKAYWISAYRAVKDPAKLAAYAALAGPAITAGGGRFLARGEPAQVYELGLTQRTVLIEFDSVAQAIRESYPDPAALIAVIAMGNAAAGTQGALTHSPTKGDPHVGIELRQEEPEKTARISR